MGKIFSKQIYDRNFCGSLILRCKNNIDIFVVFFDGILGRNIDIDILLVFFDCIWEGKNNCYTGGSILISTLKCSQKRTNNI